MPDKRSTIGGKSKDRILKVPRIIKKEWNALKKFTEDYGWQGGGSESWLGGSSKADGKYLPKGVTFSPPDLLRHSKDQNSISEDTARPDPESSKRRIRAFWVVAAVVALLVFLSIWFDA